MVCEYRTMYINYSLKRFRGLWSWELYLWLPTKQQSIKVYAIIGFMTKTKNLRIWNFYLLYTISVIIYNQGFMQPLTYYRLTVVKTQTLSWILNLIFPYMFFNQSKLWFYHSPIIFWTPGLPEGVLSNRPFLVRPSVSKYLRDRSLFFF